MMKLRKQGGKSGCLVWMFPQCIGFPSRTIPVDLTQWQEEDMGDFQYRHFPIFNRGRFHFTGLKHLGSLLRVVKVLCKVDRILSDSSESDDWLNYTIYCA